MQGAAEHTTEEATARAMYVLGQIRATICHERGPKSDTSILTVMASNPAEGFWLAISRINGAYAPARSGNRSLLIWKRKEIARLSRMLPHPLPASASATTQVPFWAGYCQYWDDVLKTHIERDDNERTHSTADTQARQINA